jgi:hypothetical protein
MGKGLASGMEEIAVDEPGGSSSMGLDPHKLEEGLKALQEQREMHAPHKRAEELPEDNPFRPPTSMGSFAPPSTDARYEEFNEDGAPFVFRSSWPARARAREDELWSPGSSIPVRMR